MKHFTAFMLIFLLTAIFIGADEKLPRKISVSVAISCDDGTTKSLIESYIKRELRSLGDVSIVDKSNNELHLLAISHTSKSTGNKTGHTSISVIRITRTNSYFDIMMALVKYHEQLNIGKPDFDKIMEIADGHSKKGYYYYPRHSLIVNISDNDLHNTCKEIVADFDTNELEFIRGYLKGIDKQMDK